jgi:hypothetical protein
MMVWLKKYWGYLVAALAAVVGIIIAIITLGGARPKPPPVPKRPKTPRVKIPEARVVKTDVVEDYEKEKVEAVDDVVNSINSRYE